MTDQQLQQFEQDFDNFVEPGFLYVARNESGKFTPLEALDRLKAATKLYVSKYNGGNSSQSAFQIMRDGLVRQGDIRPIRIAEEAEEVVPELTVAQYRSMPARQIQLKYKNDPVFREQVESLIARGLI